MPPKAQRRRRPGLSRTLREGEQLTVGPITVQLDEIHGRWARLRVVAPPEMEISQTEDKDAEPEGAA